MRRSKGLSAVAGTRTIPRTDVFASVREMTRQHATHHLASISGATVASYAAWSMLLTPAMGPLPGTAVPFAVGVLLLAVGSLLLAWGAYAIYVQSDRT